MTMKSSYSLLQLGDNVNAAIVKSIVILTFVVVFIFQAYTRIEYFLQEPVETAVHIDDDPSLKFPQVTICLPGFDKDLMKIAVPPDVEWPRYADECFYFNNFVMKEPKVNLTMIREQMLEKDFLQAARLTLLIEHREAEISVQKHMDLFGVCYVLNSGYTGVKRGDELTITLGNFSCFDSYRMSLDEVGYSADILNYGKLFTNTKSSYVLSKTKISRQNRKMTTCGDKNGRATCIQQCLAEDAGEHLNCRWPYVPPGTPCNNESSSMKQYLQVKYIASKNHLSCQCQQVCKESLYSWHLRTYTLHPIKGMAEVSFVFMDSTVVHIEERFSYSLIGLLCDLGGSLGLFLGVSVIEGVRNIYSILLTLIVVGKERKEREKRKKLKYIYKRMEHLYVEERLKNFGKSDSNLERKWFTGMKIVLFLMIVLWVFVMCMQVTMFLRRPIRHVVVTKTVMRIPEPSVSLVVCADYSHIIELRKQYARKYRVDNFCTFPIVELLKLPEVTPDMLWKTNETALDYAFAGIPAFKRTPVNVSSVILPIGTCEEYHYEMFNVTGNMAHLLLLSRKAYIVKNEACVTKLFLKTGEDTVNNFEYEELSHAMYFHDVDVRVMEVDVSGIDKNCASWSEWTGCKAHCLRTKLTETLECRLPYMPDITKAGCLLYNDSITAYETYIISSWEVENNVKCDCPEPCQRRYYRLNVASNPKEFGVDYNPKFHEIYLRMADCILKTIVSVEFYTIGKLVSEFGGHLGLFFGISALSLILRFKGEILKLYYFKRCK